MEFMTKLIFILPWWFMAYHCSSWTIMVDSDLFNKITEDHGRPWYWTMVKNRGAIVQNMVYDGPQIMMVFHC